MSEQFGRVISLVVYDQVGKGIDLSELHIQFQVNASDVETPNNAAIRVFNLSDETAGAIMRLPAEFGSVLLGAGYQDTGPIQIFKGSIKQVRRGRINPTDTYVDIFAADGDMAYNQSIVAQSAKNVDTSKQIAITLQAMSRNGVNSAVAPGINLTAGQAPVPAASSNVTLGAVLPRGKVLFGLARSVLRDLAKTNNWTWTINGGVLTFISQTGYQAGEAVVLTSKTGMIGLPQQTDNGISVVCLLNAKIQSGALLQINNKSIQTAIVGPAFTAINNLPSLNADGYYKAIVVEHEGDTRGDPWYTKIICLAVDPSNVLAPVAPYQG